MPFTLRYVDAVDLGCSERRCVRARRELHHVQARSWRTRQPSLPYRIASSSARFLQVQAQVRPVPAHASPHVPAPQELLLYSTYRDANASRQNHRLFHVAWSATCRKSSCALFFFLPNAGVLIVTIAHLLFLDAVLLLSLSLMLAQRGGMLLRS